MTPRAAQRFKALILILMAIFFAEKFVSGKLYYYIGPRFSWLAVVAVMLLIVLAGAYNLTGKRRDEHDEHEHEQGHEHGTATVWPLLIVALPLVLGVVIPAQPLGATAIATRGVATDLALSPTSADQLTVVPAERNILDWVRVMNQNPDPAALNGQEADVVGFVYRDPRMADDQFLVGRFTLTCCVADALAIGVLVQSDQVAEFEEDTWVRVTGTFAEGSIDGQGIAVLKADEIVRAQEPEQPYLYP
jgi:putative membrane protein